MKLAVFVCSARQRRRERGWGVSRWRTARDHPARVGGASVSITRGRHSFLFILLHCPPLVSLFRVGNAVIATLCPRRDQNRPFRELQSMGELDVASIVCVATSEINIGERCWRFKIVWHRDTRTSSIVFKRKTNGIRRADPERTGIQEGH